LNNTCTDESDALGGGFFAGDLGSDAWIILESNQIINNHINAVYHAGGGGVGLTCNGKLTDNVISYNSCISTGWEANGGGVKITAESSSSPRTVLMQGNKITHNFAEGKKVSGHNGAKGAGIVNHYCKVIIFENEILYNQLNAIEGGDAYGAGISMSFANNDSKISCNTISFNTIASDIPSGGGGIGISQCTVSVTNNIVHKNFAPNGGGIRFNLSNSELLNNTIVNNSAATGGGIYNMASSPIVINNIVWDNQADVSPGIHQLSGTINVRYSDVQGDWEGEGNVDAKPIFADTANGDFHLLAGSPGVGWGMDSSIVPKTDYYGNIRPHSTDEFVDMGAIESQFKQTPPTSVDDLNNTLPFEFALLQNYPNPFNPVTSIKYQVPRTSNVKLSIYNLLGQKVTALVSEKQPAGNYKVEWDAGRFASGIYLYHITAGRFTETKKLVLLK